MPVRRRRRITPRHRPRREERLVRHFATPSVGADRRVGLRRRTSESRTTRVGSSGGRAAKPAAGARSKSIMLPAPGCITTCGIVPSFLLQALLAWTCTMPGSDVAGAAVKELYNPETGVADLAFVGSCNVGIRCCRRRSHRLVQSGNRCCSPCHRGPVQRRDPMLQAPQQRSSAIRKPVLQASPSWARATSEPDVVGAAVTNVYNPGTAVGGLALVASCNVVTRCCRRRGRGPIQSRNRCCRRCSHAFVQSNIWFCRPRPRGPVQRRDPMLQASWSRSSAIREAMLQAPPWWARATSEPDFAGAAATVFCDPGSAVAGFGFVATIRRTDDLS